MATGRKMGKQQVEMETIDAGDEAYPSVYPVVYVVSDTEDNLIDSVWFDCHKAMAHAKALGKFFDTERWCVLQEPE